MELVGRIFLCARCRNRTVLCSSCDRGQRYCGEDCARAARDEAQRAAGRRYQSGDVGRAHHVERTRRWRLRQKERGVPGAPDGGFVTHQGSPQAPTSEFVLPSSLLPCVEVKATVEANPPTQMRWICPWCAVALHPAVRLGFINRRRTRARMRSAKVPPSPGATAARCDAEVDSTKNANPPLRHHIDADLHQR